MRSQTNNMKRMNNFLTRATLSQVDEKVAMLYSYSNDVKDWTKEGIDVTFMTSKIVSDITAITRLRNDISDDQKIKLNEAIRHLTDTMKKHNYDTGRIEDITKVLNSN
jgi:hypothetical protein